MPFVVFGSWRFPVDHAPVRGVLVWDKGAKVGQGDLTFPWKQNWELIFVGGPGFVGHRGPGVLRHLAKQPAFKHYHPHEKPVSLFVDLLSKCPPGVVLDPFMGTGPTLRAAKDIGARAIGIEIEEAYCEIAARRMEQTVFEFRG